MKGEAKGRRGEETPSGGHRRHFDAFGLVATRGSVEGTVDPIDLERIEDRLGDEEGEIPVAAITWRISGDTDALGRAVLNVALDGEVPLQCQRCMRPFFWPVHQSTTVLLAHDETQLAFLDDSDEREVVLAAGRLDPLEIVEDELVLTLPYVPRCDRPDCLALDASVRAGDEPAARSAFDALAALKQGGKPPKK